MIHSIVPYKVFIWKIKKGLNCNWAFLFDYYYFFNDNFLDVLHWHIVSKKESGIERKDLFITTKLYPDDMGYDKTLKAFEKSCSKLQTNYIGKIFFHLIFLNFLGLNWN